MIRRLFLMSLILSSVMTTAQTSPRWVTQFTVPSRPVFCAGLMTTIFDKSAKPARTQAATFTGSAQINKFLNAEQANRDLYKSAIDRYQGGRNPFSPQTFFKTLYLYQGVGSPFMWFLAVGLVDVVLRGGNSPSQILGLAGIDGFLWATGLLGVPIRFLRGISFRSGQLNQRVQNFLRTDLESDLYRTSFRVGSEILNPLRVTGDVTPRLLSEQNFRDVTSGVPRIIMNLYRNLRARTDELWTVEARLFRGENGTPVLTITTQQTDL